MIILYQFQYYSLLLFVHTCIRTYIERFLFAHNTYTQVVRLYVLCDIILYYWKFLLVIIIILHYHDIVFLSLLFIVLVIFINVQFNVTVINFYKHVNCDCTRLLYNYISNLVAILY